MQKFLHFITIFIFFITSQVTAESFRVETETETRDIYLDISGDSKLTKFVLSTLGATEQLRIQIGYQESELKTIVTNSGLAIKNLPAFNIDVITTTGTIPLKIHATNEAMAISAAEIATQILHTSGYAFANLKNVVGPNLELKDLSFYSVELVLGQDDLQFYVHSEESAERVRLAVEAATRNVKARGGFRGVFVGKRYAPCENNLIED